MKRGGFASLIIASPLIMESQSIGSFEFYPRREFFNVLEIQKFLMENYATGNSPQKQNALFHLNMLS
jgi:hypothetical protein